MIVETSIRSQKPCLGLTRADVLNYRDNKTREDWYGLEKVSVARWDTNNSWASWRPMEELRMTERQKRINGFHPRRIESERLIEVIPRRAWPPVRQGRQVQDA